MVKSQEHQLPDDPIRRQWKMLHLLHLYGRPGIAYQELWDAGVDCIVDAIEPTVDAKLATLRDGVFKLAKPAKKVLENFALVYKAGRSGDFRVDYPSVFVVMPYREPWNSVFSKAVLPAATDVQMDCVRADKTVLIGDLGDNVWSQILGAGLIVADVSSRNPNVFYEIGLAVALGKDTMFLKKKGAKPPADLKGALYYEYREDRPEKLRPTLRDAFKRWSKKRSAAGVASLYSDKAL